VDRSAVGSQTDRSDLNVPLALQCELFGMARWLERVP
jgi:hypothetical protein